MIHLKLHAMRSTIEALMNMIGNKILLHLQDKLLVVFLDTYKDFSSSLPLGLMNYHRQAGVTHTAIMPYK